MGDLIAEVKPDTILTFGPDGMTGHPDHRTVSAWTTEAWRRNGRQARLFHAAVTAAHVLSFATVYEQWGVFMTDDRPGGVEESELAIAFRLDDALLARKLSALRAMPSQTAGAFESLGEEVFGRLNETEWFIEHEER
ncbi:MAG: PIG-L deacetylase family protein, partial [Acidimicrobiia bacterium]